MSDTQVKIINGITPNFESTASKDFVEILNKIAEGMDGVSNMGVFADITKVTQLKEMVADVLDSYVTVTTKQMEKPHRDLVATTDVTDPYQLELSVLYTEKPSVTELKAQSQSSEPLDDDDDDYDDDDEQEEESLKDMFANPFKDVKKEMSKSFKDVGQAYAKSFKDMTKPFNRK